MNEIEITHIKWDGFKIGVALHKMVDGYNKINVTAKNKSGKLIHSEPILLNKQNAIEKYGVSIINKNGLKGVWISL